MYVKKTALGQQTIDISGLEAPQDVPAGDGDKVVTNGGSANSSQCSQDSNPSAENSQNDEISESLSDVGHLAVGYGDICESKVNNLAAEKEVSVHSNGGVEMNGNKVEENGNNEKQIIDAPEENGNNMDVDKLSKSEAVLETATAVNNLSVEVL